MTVTTTTNRGTGTGDGATTAFTFTFALQQSGDMDVYKDDVLQGSGYTVAINSNGVGGTVTFTTAPASGVAIVFIRTVDYTQATDFPVEGVISEETLENALDKLTMMAQQLKEITDRKVGVTEGTSGVNLELPTPTALKILRWNAGATALENVSANSAMSDAGGNGGNVVGPSPASSTTKTLAAWADTGGRTLEATISNGTSGDLLTSNGAGSVPSFQTPAVRFGGWGSNARPLPTSGAISGDYYMNTAWTSAGSLTCTGPVRVFTSSTFNLAAGHTITCGTYFAGGIANPTAGATDGQPQNGSGPGGGQGGTSNAAAAEGGGGGGGSYGAGGKGGNAALAQGGRPYIINENGFNGSGGGGGTFYTTGGGAGGAGGAGFYLEAKGNVTLAGTITADGAVGANGGGGANDGGGGGGGAGVIDIRTLGTVNYTGALNARGGAGGTGVNGFSGGGGGGGLVRVWAVGAITDSGTTAVTGGLKGASGTQGVDGSAGLKSFSGSDSTVVPRIAFH